MRYIREKVSILFNPPSRTRRSIWIVCIPKMVELAYQAGKLDEQDTQFMQGSERD